MEKEHKNDLSNEELCVLAQGGDAEAVMLLLQNCGSYIGGLIKMLGIPPIRYRRELVEWGEIGVLESIRSFDPTMGTKFLTFAHYNILNELKLFLESFRIVAKEVNFPGKENTSDEICEWALELDCFKANPEIRPMEKAYERKLRDALLEAILDALPEQESTYVNYRYGFATNKPMHNFEVAAWMEIPEKEAQRMEQDVLDYCRECFALSKVIPFYELRPEAETQKELARQSRESCYDNFAGTHVDMLMSQFEEEDE